MDPGKARSPAVRRSVDTEPGDFLDNDASPRSEPQPRADEGVTALYAAHAVGLISPGFVMIGTVFLSLYRNWYRLNDPGNAQARGYRRDRAAARDGQPPPSPDKPGGACEGPAGEQVEGLTAGCARLG
jgi:hypothetical protein